MRRYGYFWMLVLAFCPHAGLAQQAPEWYRDQLDAAGDSLLVAAGQHVLWDGDSLESDSVALDLLQRYEQATDSTEAASALEALGNHYRDKGDVFRALDRYLQALEVGPVDRVAEARVAREVGLLYTKIKEFEESVAFLDWAASLFQETDNRHAAAEAMQRLAEVLRQVGRFDEAAVHWDAAEAIHAELDSTRHQIRSLNALGELHLLQGNHDEALRHFDQAAQLNRTITDRDTHIDTQHGLAKVNLGRGRFSAAEREAREALRHALLARDAVDLRDIYATLAEILKRMQRLGEAIETLQRHYQYADSVAAMERAFEMQLMASKVGFQQEKKQMLAAQQAREAVLKDEIYKQRLLMAAIGILCLVAVAVSVVALRKGREMRAMNSLLQTKGREVMEQKQILEEQAVQLNETMEVKDRLLSILAHDLRSPLANLAGMLALAEQQAVSDGELREWLPQVRRTMESNSVMLDNLLLWARQQWKGDGTVHRESVDVHALIERKAALFEPMARSKAIRLSLEVPVGTTAYADPAMLDVVMHNLISNALKFTPNGGAVTVGAQTPGREVEIYVADTGIGMSAEEQANLFNVGSRVRAGTAEEKGTGLGLVVCHDFVEANQGTIAVTSEPGKGTQFTVTLSAQA